jgi:hypothetical protein
MDCGSCVFVLLRKQNYQKCSTVVLRNHTSSLGGTHHHLKTAKDARQWENCEDYTDSLPRRQKTCPDSLSQSLQIDHPNF